MGAKHSLGLLIVAVVLALLVMAVSNWHAVGYNDCDTHTCHLVTK